MRSTRRTVTGEYNQHGYAVLLCRHHHLLVHNNGWAIHRTGREYWLYPPPGVADPPVLLESKSRALRRLLQAA